MARNDLRRTTVVDSQWVASAVFGSIPKSCNISISHWRSKAISSPAKSFFLEIINSTTYWCLYSSILLPPAGKCYRLLVSDRVGTVNERTSLLASAPSKPKTSLKNHGRRNFYFSSRNLAFSRFSDQSIHGPLFISYEIFFFLILNFKVLFFILRPKGYTFSAPNLFFLFSLSFFSLFISLSLSLSHLYSLSVSLPHHHLFRLLSLSISLYLDFYFLSWYG